VKLAVAEAEPLAEPCAVDDNKAEVVVEARAVALRLLAAETLCVALPLPLVVAAAD
jgi:hypothetical protein